MHNNILSVDTLTWIMWKMYDEVTNCFTYNPRKKDQLNNVDKDFAEKFGIFF